MIPAPITSTAHDRWLGGSGRNGDSGAFIYETRVDRFIHARPSATIKREFRPAPM
jgi:hypothetical protein